jgi:hypothetical protein
MPGTLVRPSPSVTTIPRSTLTPSVSSPTPSMLETTPTAEISRSAAQLLSAALAVVHRGGDGIRPLLDARDLGAGEDLDALLLEAFSREPGDLRVLDGQDLGQKLDHRHLRAHGAVEGGELDADGAGAITRSDFGMAGGTMAS